MTDYYLLHKQWHDLNEIIHLAEANIVAEVTSDQLSSLEGIRNLIEWSLDEAEKRGEFKYPPEEQP